MDKPINLDELTGLTDNPDFIESIYNYCDRWCERCAVEMQFTAAHAFVRPGFDADDLPLPAAVA